MPAHDLFRKAPYNRFEEFIAPNADRFALLCSVLDECDLAYRVFEIEEKRHIAASGTRATAAGSSPGSLSNPRVMFTAHYDRTPQSPGANDNGAAVFFLIETALRFAARRSTGFVQDGISGGGSSAVFIFTDGEELSKGDALRSQGSYSLGLHLKKNGLGNSPLFTFDACGTGDTLIISTAADLLLKNERGSAAEAARKKAQVRRRTALEAARAARLEKVLLLPTPFSEDAGFLLAGMTAQTITVLPQSEAALVKGDSAALFSQADRRLIPETWRIINGPGDSPLRLTPEHWKNIPLFIEALIEISRG